MPRSKHKIHKTSKLETQAPALQHRRYRPAKGKFNRNQKLALGFLLLLLLGLLTGGLLYLFMPRQTQNHSKDLSKKPSPTPLGPPPCSQFEKITFNAGSKSKKPPIKIFGELHGHNEMELVRCMEQETKNYKMVHIVIEWRGDKTQEIPCNTVHKAYEKFTHCYPGDVGEHTARLIYGQSAELANFIYRYHQMFLQGALTGKDVSIKLRSFADFFIEQAADPATQASLRETSEHGSAVVEASLSQSQDFFRNYIHDLAEKIEKLPIEEVLPLLTFENNRLIEQSNYYEKFSRQGPSNKKLVEALLHHSSVLSNVPDSSVSGIFGASHIDPKVNQQLEQVIAGADAEVTIYLPKKYLSNK